MSRYPERWRAPEYLPACCSIGQPGVVARALEYVTRHGCVIQAGAHVGIWPAALSPHFRRVIAFEPLPQLWRCSIDAVQADNVLVMPCAVTTATGTVQIHAVKEERFSGSSAVASIGAVVPAIAIDDLPGVLTDDLGAIFLDIEGHELPALLGARRTLRRWHPVVVVEQNAKSLRNRSPEAVAELLAPLGYRQVEAFGSDLIYSAGPPART